MPLRNLASGTGANGREQPKVDIVAVHGLNPFNNPDHAFDTWRKPKGNDGKLWLRDYLPKDVPNARIFLYKYNSNPVFGATKERFVHQANDLLEGIHIERIENSKRPLILIGHSLGGILIKQVKIADCPGVRLYANAVDQALVNAHNNPRYSPIKESTKGLVFFGTPHAGGKDALISLGNVSIRIVRGLFWDPPNDIMEALTKGSLYSDILQESWRQQLSLYRIVSFYEGIGEIVSRESAVIGLPGDVENQVRLEADHSGLCRFDESVEEDVDNYKYVSANMKELYVTALQVSGTLEETKPVVLHPLRQRTALQVNGMLRKAIEDKDAQTMRQLLIDRPDMGIRRNDGATLLIDAVKARFFEGTNMLLMKDSRCINDQDNQGRTVLYHAAEIGDAEVVELLLQHGADTEMRNPDSQTALIIASSNGWLEAVKVLVRYDAKLDIIYQKNSVLGHAIVNDHFEVVKYLIKSGASSESEDPSRIAAVCSAAQNGNLEILDYLLQKNFYHEVHAVPEMLPLCYAAKQAFVAVLSRLLQAHMDVNCKDGDGDSPLHIAAMFNNEDAIAFLISRNADIKAQNNAGRTPLHEASREGHCGAIKALLDGGSDPERKSSQGWTALHKAAYFGHAEAVTILLDRGASLEAKTSDNHQLSALRLSAENGHEQVAMILLSRGSDVNRRMIHEQTALHRAAGYGTVGTIDVLLQYKANIEAVNQWGGTPLRYAAWSGMEEKVSFLISRGADINAKANHGYSALHQAARSGHSAVVELLLSKGADSKVKDRKGKSALDLARASSKEGRSEVTRLLENHARHK